MAVHRVLLPLDGSALSERSLEYIRLFSGLGSPQFELLSVKEAGDGRADVAGIEAYLRGIAEELQPALGAKVLAKVRHGIPYLAILDEAEDDRVSLIIISTHGWSDPKSRRMGSVADKVIRGSPCPVLIIGPLCQPAPGSIRHILVPLDGSQLAELALPVAGLLAQQIGARIRLMRIHPSAVEVDPAGMHQGESEAQSYLDQAAQRLPQSDGVETLVAAGTPTEVLQADALKHEIDLIVMSSHGHHGFVSYALGSVTEGLIPGPIPVLIVRPGQAERTRGWST